MEFYGRMSFLKAGIQSADAITTVSPTYASEILTPEYGCGLDGLLRKRASTLTGILNGVDYRIWDPSTDPYLACNYSARSVAAKSDCKRAIQMELGLKLDADMPLMAFMSRLVHQKMPDVVLDVLPDLLEEGMQFVLVAEGENGYQTRFRELAARYPGRVAVKIGYREDLGHRLLSGADLLLHPSRFEPCGLVPIYAMRYGTIPLVRKERRAGRQRHRCLARSHSPGNRDRSRVPRSFDGRSRGLYTPRAVALSAADPLAQDPGRRHAPGFFVEALGPGLRESLSLADRRSRTRRFPQLHVENSGVRNRPKSSRKPIARFSK